MNRWWRKAAWLLCFSCICLNAQAQEVIYSGYEKYDMRSGDFSVIGKVGGRLYTYRSTNDGFFMDIWTDSMTREATVILDFFPNKIYETKFVAYPDKVIVLYQGLERGKVIQYAARMDETGRLVGDPVKIDSVKTGFFGPNKDYFSSVVSDDKRNIVVYGVNPKGAVLNIGATILDDNLGKIGRFHSEFEGEGRMSAGTGMVSNAGVFYLPVYSIAGSDDNAARIWLLSRKAGETSYSRTELPLEEKFATSTFMRVDNSANRVYAGGFYSEKKSGNYDGIIYAQYDISARSFTTRKLIPFDDSLKAATGARSAKRAFNNYQTRQLIVKNDGGFVLISEAYYLSVRNTGPGYGYGYGFYPMYGSPFMSSRNIREYHYDDILALSYNGDGVREWHAFVRKDQYSQEDGGVFSSYALLNTGGSLGFLYNNFNGRRSEIQLATIDPGGQVKMRSMSPSGNDSPDWLPRAGKQVSSRELIIPCLRKKQICFAKIIF